MAASAPEDASRVHGTRVSLQIRVLDLLASCLAVSLMHSPFFRRRRWLQLQVTGEREEDRRPPFALLPFSLGCSSCWLFRSTRAAHSHAPRERDARPRVLLNPVQTADACMPLSLHPFPSLIVASFSLLARLLLCFMSWKVNPRLLLLLLLLAGERESERERETERGEAGSLSLSMSPGLPATVAGNSEPYSTARV